MAYTYTWTDAEQTGLRREDEDGNVAFVPASEGNRDYAEFVSSGATAADYVEPPVVADSRTDEQKLEDATGLTVAEIKAVLGIS